MLIYSVLLAFLAVAAVLDHCSGKVPNVLILLMLTAGFGLHIAAKDFVLLVMFHMLFPGVVLFVFFRMRIIGAGDIKLMCAVSTYIGFQVWSAWLIALLFASFAGIIRLWRKGLLKSRLMAAIGYLISMIQCRKVEAYRYGIQQKDKVTLPLSGFMGIAVLMQCIMQIAGSDWR
jgi:prepilin peptidase CpaA